MYTFINYIKYDMHILHLIRLTPTHTHTYIYIFHIFTILLLCQYL